MKPFFLSGLLIAIAFTTSGCQNRQLEVTLPPPRTLSLADCLDVASSRPTMQGVALAKTQCESYQASRQKLWKVRAWADFNLKSNSDDKQRRDEEDAQTAFFARADVQEFYAPGSLNIEQFEAFATALNGVQPYSQLSKLEFFNAVDEKVRTRNK